MLKPLKLHKTVFGTNTVLKTFRGSEGKIAWQKDKLNKFAYAHSHSFIRQGHFSTKKLSIYFPIKKLLKA
jgi:hypothetical protein